MIYWHIHILLQLYWILSMIKLKQLKCLEMTCFEMETVIRHLVEPPMAALTSLFGYFSTNFVQLLSFVSLLLLFHPQSWHLELPWCWKCNTVALNNIWRIWIQILGTCTFLVFFVCMFTMSFLLLCIHLCKQLFCFKLGRHWFCFVSWLLGVWSIPLGVWRGVGQRLSSVSL